MMIKSHHLKYAEAAGLLIGIMAWVSDWHGDAAATAKYRRFDERLFQSQVDCSIRAARNSMHFEAALTRAYPGGAPSDSSDFYEKAWGSFEVREFWGYRFHEHCSCVLERIGIVEEFRGKSLQDTSRKEPILRRRLLAAHDVAGPLHGGIPIPGPMSFKQSQTCAESLLAVERDTNTLVARTRVRFQNERRLWSIWHKSFVAFGAVIIAAAKAAEGRIMRQIDNEPAINVKLRPKLPPQPDDTEIEGSDT